MQLPLFPRCFWDPGGRHWGCGREGTRKSTVHESSHDQTDRQTDTLTVFIYMCHSQNTRHSPTNEQTSFYKWRFSKCQQAVHSHKWVGIVAYTSPWSFQCTFFFFFPNTKYLHLQPPAPWKLCQKENKKISLKVCCLSIPSLYRPKREKIKYV